MPRPVFLQFGQPKCKVIRYRRSLLPVIKPEHRPSPQPLQADKTEWDTTQEAVAGRGWGGWGCRREGMEVGKAEWGVGGGGRDGGRGFTSVNGKSLIAPRLAMYDRHSPRRATVWPPGRPRTPVRSGNKRVVGDRRMMRAESACCHGECAIISPLPLLYFWNLPYEVAAERLRGEVIGTKLSSLGNYAHSD